jgi:cation diffusion facilitator family transporter
MTADKGIKVVITGLLANLAIAAFKYLAAYMSGSSSMLAEGHHSVADTLNAVLLLVGLFSSRRAATERHNFGFGKVQFFWSFVVALILFSVAGGLSIKGGVHKIMHPEPLQDVWWSYAAIVVSLFFDGLALKVSYKELKDRMRAMGETSVVQAFRECSDAVVITTLMENLLAVVGLVIAGLAVLGAHLTGAVVLDGAASILIGLCLMIFAFLLAVEVQAMLIGEALPPKIVAKLRLGMEKHPHVQRVLDLRSMLLGPDQSLVAVQLEFTPTLSTAQLVDAINGIEDAIRAEVPGAKCFIEADRLKEPLARG